MHFSFGLGGAGATEGAASVIFHLLGCVPYQACARLQQQLVGEARRAEKPKCVVLLAEHPPEITVGRRGSRRHVRLSADELAHRHLQVRWAPRGGGCVLHAPGQLAVYPILPLAQLGWTLPKFRQIFHAGMTRTLLDCGYDLKPTLPGAGIWGNSGVLAASGLGETDGVTHHGAWLNVNPDMHGFETIDIVPPDQVDKTVATTMSSLFAEQRRPIRMSTIRSALIEHMAAAFGCEAPHISTGHPCL
ncbi:MAG: hypothetical protein U0939_07880 [Pirellulales bacterium]